MIFEKPAARSLRWKRQYRIVATRYPPIDLFERLDLSNHDKRLLWALQSRVNPRLLQQSGNLQLVREDDIVSGPNASVVMSAFTHAGFNSRFSSGTFGVYYGGHALETAIRETCFHRERDARERGLVAQEFDMRAYVGQIKRPMYDIRDDRYSYLHDPDPEKYPVSQSFALSLLQSDPDAWGIVFNSVRHPNGECIAALRPPAVSLPISGPLLTYVWNGEKIAMVYEKSGPLVCFDDQ
ncbi:MAG: RES family NAD+ phosphorylase [Gammaproteobacteria bacterium]|nr:RES family NAD+ phosphorylase [Gammaproteobacteria bacterium]